jgi:hypothetical protein
MRQKMMHKSGKIENQIMNHRGHREIMTKLMIWMTSLCFVFVSGIKFVAAQEDGFEPVYKGLSLVFFEWSRDSQSVWFKDYYEIDETTQWLIYTLSTHRIETFDIVTHPDIRTLLKTHPIAPLPTFEGAAALIYPSYDNRFAAYATKRGDSGVYGLAITDLTTSQSVVIERIQPAFASDPFYFDVRWSESSQAFFVQVLRETLIYYYYINVSQGLDRLEVISLYGEDSDFHIKTECRLARVYDIDSTGRFLLVDGSNVSLNPDISGLALLDMTNLNVEQVAQVHRSFARFNRTDNNKISFVTESGVYEYDRTFKSIRLRNQTITTALAKELIFSPNGQYIALTSSDHPDDLYVLKIELMPLPTITYQ